MSTSRNITVNALARVEGEGGLIVKTKGKRVVEAKLRIYEPPRFFEAFLRGRQFTEAPDITARICGICPIAYQMSASHAMENACGVEVKGPLRDLRRLVYCGEWIESHVLHVYMLHAPDFLGYENVLQIARESPEIVQRGLRLKKIGNELVTLLGGREIHPINVRLGGFHKTPTARQLAPFAEKLKWASEAARETIDWVAGFKFPEFEQDYEFVALRHPEEYPFNEGRLASSKGLDIPISDFENFFVEEQVPHSNALHCHTKKGGTYITGPMARFNLNFDKLPAHVQKAARQAGLKPNCLNLFKSIITRSVEILYACDEALRIIEEYTPPPAPFVRVEPRAATGYGCTEAPRGVLYHRYTIDEKGTILNAKIVPPTSQNQSRIEEDLKYFVEENLAKPTEKLTLQCEQLIRNYDPCISCATHFLNLKLEEE
jgi:coenzyme F420-reducing hydrogenase alpha subunit